MSITIQLKFPAGRYHATPWGRHVNEGVAEWPPSPWRLLRAFVAVWKRTCPELPTDVVRSLLEQLADPPEFLLPPHRVAHTRHVMPMNLLAASYLPSKPERKQRFQGDPTFVFDTFVVINRADSVWVRWPQANLTAVQLESLSLILRNLSSLGRAEGWVEASLAIDSLVPLQEWIVPQAQTNNPHPVLCADPASAFSNTHYPIHDQKKLAKGKIKIEDYLFDCPDWHLCLDTQTIHQQRWNLIPGAKWVNYSRPVERIVPRQRPAPSPRSLPKWLLFTLDGPVLPTRTDTIVIAELFRRAAMSRFNRWCARQSTQLVDHFRVAEDQFASPTLSGKDLHAKFLRDHSHARYLPLSLQAAPHQITHILVHATRGFEPQEIASLETLWTIKPNSNLARLKNQQWQVRLTGRGGDDDPPLPLFRESKHLVSITPFVGYQRESDLKQQKYLCRTIRSDWQNLRKVVPQFADVELDAEIQELSGEISSYRFVRQRMKDRSVGIPPGSCGFFRLTFSKPIRGPLCLGYGSHYGLGLFAAE